MTLMAKSGFKNHSHLFSGAIFRANQTVKLQSPYDRIKLTNDKKAVR